MFHFIDEKLWLIVAPLASMQFPKDNGFDEGKFIILQVLWVFLTTC